MTHIFGLEAIFNLPWKYLFVCALRTWNFFFHGISHFEFSFFHMAFCILNFEFSFFRMAFRRRHFCILSSTLFSFQFLPFNFPKKGVAQTLIRGPLKRRRSRRLSGREGTFGQHLFSENWYTTNSCWSSCHSSVLTTWLWTKPYGQAHLCDQDWDKIGVKPSAVPIYE